MQTTAVSFEITHFLSPLPSSCNHNNFFSNFKKMSKNRYFDCKVIFCVDNVIVFSVLRLRLWNLSHTAHGTHLQI